MTSIIIDEKQKVSSDGVKVFSAQIQSDVNAKYTVVLENVDGQCFNCQGKDYSGVDFVKEIYVKENIAKRIWFWVKIDKDCSANVCVKDDLGQVVIKKEIKFVIDATIEKDELSKLLWLNSDYAINSDVPKPFTPVEKTEKGVRILGREIEFSKLGFPEKIYTYFNQSGKITKRKANILSKPIDFIIDNETFEVIDKKINFNSDSATLNVVAESELFKLQLIAKIEFDGYVRYELKLTAKKDVATKVVKLNVPMAKRFRTYFVGLGKKGGLFDKKLKWKWNKNHQDAFWCGDTDGGLRVALQGANYQKPLVNIYYVHKPLNMPESWYNDGKGGVKYAKGAFIAYAGEKVWNKGESLNFNFELMITPFKEIDLYKQFTNRYFHTMFDSDTWIDRAVEGGANVINVHHGNDLNPFINYPFVEEDALKEFVDKCHDKGIKAKIYNTVRELTINVPEFKVIRDLDYEIVQRSNDEVDSPIWQGEARTWIKNKLGSDVIPAWRQPLKGEKYKDFFDSAIITDGQSRLCNFYIEGLKYLVERVGIDGLYVDDIAYDRNTMKRVRKTLDLREGAYIDFHTWDHFNAYGGMVNCAVLYASLFPYVDKLWVGEGFNFNYETHSPEYWLTEISGMPFGVMSEMMDAGNAWKGLLFGMTSRLGWVGEISNGDPRNIWQLFDKVKLAKSELIGWWDKRNPVTLSDERLRASVYKKGKKLYVAVANFSDAQVDVCIKIKARKQFVAKTVYIKDLQQEKIVDLNGLTISGRGGAFIEIN